MNNEQAFAESFINLFHTVLGKRLRPLSLNHLIWLYNIESPLVFTDKETTLADLELATLICSQDTHERILRAIDGKARRLPGKFAKYFWRFVNCNCRNFNTELKRFIAYQDDYLALPKFFPNDETKESNDSIPWLLLHATALIKATGWSEETVFKLPIGKLLWFNLAFGFLNTGETRILSDKEQQAIDALKSLTAVK